MEEKQSIIAVGAGASTKVVIPDEKVMIDQKTGKEICAIVKLKTRIEGHKATPTDDFQIIKDVMVTKMKQQKLENWIKEKQKSTYVRINE